MKQSSRVWNKKIVSWCLFDWAYSPFSVIILTFLFPPFFSHHIETNPIQGAHDWGTMVSLASLIVCVLSPPLGAIADQTQRCKPWLLGCALLTIVSSIGLLWGNSSTVTWTLVLVGAGIVGIEVAAVFYNTLLRTIAPPQAIGRTSGIGWATGYIGGLVSLFVCLGILETPSIMAHITLQPSPPLQLLGPFVAGWYVLFAWPLFAFSPDLSLPKKPLWQAMKHGLQTLGNTLRQLPRRRDISYFIVARFFYMDALMTLFFFAGIFAVDEFHFSTTELLLYGIATNLGAGLGAFLFGWMDDALSPLFTLCLSLICMIGAIVGFLFVHQALIFWITGIFLSIFVGPTQSASRSLMTRLAPPAQLTEMFGLFALSGKATAFLGPWAFGYVTSIFGTPRAGIFVILVSFLLGLGLLYFVRRYHTQLD